MAKYKWVSGKGKKTAGNGRGQTTAGSSRAQATAGSSRVQTTTGSGRAPAAAGSSRAPAAAGSSRVQATTGNDAYGRKRKTAKRRNKGAIAALIVILILIIGSAASVLYLGYYVRDLDTVFPNVWADGIKLSGMTFEEARQTLIGMGYESNADGVSATIVFPDGSSFTVFGDEAGFSLNAEEAARAAFEYGRDGTFFENGFTFLRSRSTDTELSDVSIAKFNEEYVREAAVAHVRIYNDTLMDDAYTENEDSFVIVKGITFAQADETTVHELAVTTLKKAMEEKAHLTAEYDPELSVTKEIDLSMLHGRIHKEPISAEYDPETFSATESFPGVTFDIEAAQVMLDRAGMGERIVIPFISIEPDVKTEDIESLLFRDILAESTTLISGTPNRINNVELSSSFVDGTLLNPGDTFSFNETVGRRTAERGFKEASAFTGELVINEIGGGICQTSSTIYLSVLKADLQVVERRPHTMTVSYIPLGSDATIDWGNIDFKFRNSTDYPIRVEVEIDGRNLTVRLVGTKLDDNHIKIDYVIISTTPWEVVMREDEDIPPGETERITDGSTGYVVDTFKNLFDADDNLISRTLVGRSIYQVQHRIFLVSPESEDDSDDDSDDDPEDPDNPEDPNDPEGTDEPNGFDDPDDTDDPDGSEDSYDPYDPSYPGDSHEGETDQTGDSQEPDD